MSRKRLCIASCIGLVHNQSCKWISLHVNMVSRCDFMIAVHLFDLGAALMLCFTASDRRISVRGAQRMALWSKLNQPEIQISKRPAACFFKWVSPWNEADRPSAEIFRAFPARLVESGWKRLVFIKEFAGLMDWVDHWRRPLCLW